MPTKPKPLPPRFSCNDPALQTYIDGIYEYLMATRIPAFIGGNKIAVSEGPNGVVIAVVDNEQNERLPWQPMIDRTEADAFVYFWYGTVNQILPSNQLDSEGLARFSIPQGLTIWSVYATTNGKSVATLEIVSAASAPAPIDATTPEAPTEFTFPIVATFREGNEVIAEHIRKSHVLATPTEVLRVPKGSWAVGELAYDPYINWQVEDA